MDQLKQESLTILSNVAEAITAASDAQGLADALFKVVDNFVDVPYSSIFLWDFQAEKLRLYANKGFSEEDKKHSEDTAMERHPGWVFKNRQPLHVRNMETEIVPLYVKSGKRSYEVKSRLWLPIATADRSLGAFGFSSGEVDYFTEEHKSILHLVCRLAGNIYSNIVFSASEKQYIESLKLSMRKIQDASNSQQNFIAKMSHEMRTPLNGILGMSRLLEESGLLPAQKKYVDIISSQSGVLLNLINDILDTSKVHSEGFQLVHFPFDITEAVSNGVRSHELQANQKSLQLTCKIDPAIAFKVMGDALRFSQIVSNLVSNAVKFTPDGKVDVQLNVLENHEKKVTLELTVTDTGTGIPVEDREKIFGRFVQGDDSISRQYGGSGLGLYLTRELVLKMNGNITVSNNNEKGSCFRVVLPMEKYVPKISAGEKKYRKDFSGLRVLIVEDNAVNALYLSSLLTKKGFTVDEANDGMQAIERCKKNTYDIVLMDLQMPLADGISATRAIRTELKQHMPIVAQSANTVQKDIDACFAVGMNDYLSKPFTAEQLTEKLSLALGIELKQHQEEKTENSAPHSSSLIFEKALKIAENNSETAKRLLHLFMLELPKSMNNLKKAIESKDLAALKKLGHKYKSSFRLFGIDDAADLCYKLEKTDEQAVNWDEATAIHEQLLKRSEEVGKEIESIA